MPFLIQLILAALIIVAGVFVAFAWLRNRKQKIVERLKMKLLLLRFSRGKQEGKDPLQEIGLTEQLFGAVAGLKKPVVFEVAIPHIGEEISFYAAVPAQIYSAFIRQVHSLWSDALVEEVGDYNIFNYTGASLGGWVTLKDSYILPVKTYNQMRADTFQPILGGLAKVDEIGEGGALQIVVRPPTSFYKKELKSALRLLKKGWSLKEISARSPISGVVETIFGGSKKKAEPGEIRVDEEEVKALENKLAKPLLEVNLRVMASAPNQAQAESIFDGLTAGFSQLNAPDRNEFKIVKSRNIKKLAHRFSFREFNEKQKMVLNTEELASIFHLPTSFTEIPKIKMLKSKQLSSPASLVTEGTPLGESVYRGERKRVYISDDDRRRHLYTIGQTGTGKSTLLINTVCSDIERGKGVSVIDPHGDLIEHILGLIPKKRFDDVILFDPSSLERPLGLNMLEYDLERPEEKTFIVNEMVGIFDKLYDLKATGGPMFEQYMRNALLLLMEDAKHEPATLMEVPRLFTDADYRERKLKRIQNPSVIDFWEKEAVKAGGEAALANITPYITSKFNNFIANDYMRIIVGQTKSAFSFRRVMDEGKILLVNLSKGKIGDLNAGLLGMIIVGKILMAALGRASLPEEQRRDFNLVIDEFQNFTTDSIAVILSEARKYRLSLTIAHQFIAQLTEETRDAVFGNVGSLAVFRIGAQDAEFVIKQFEPFLEIEDLVNIDNYNAYVKLLVRGETTKPFNIATFPPPPFDVGRAAQLEELLKRKYGAQREEVEQEIRRRLRA